jgi:hypothetical protein
VLSQTLKEVIRVSKSRRIVAVCLTLGAFMGGSTAVALGAAPGPGSKPQCAGGPSNGNPHCPQNGGK